MPNLELWYSVQWDSLWTFGMRLCCIKRDGKVDMEGRLKFSPIILSIFITSRELYMVGSLSLKKTLPMIHQSFKLVVIMEVLTYWWMLGAVSYINWKWRLYGRALIYIKVGKLAWWHSLLLQEKNKDKDIDDARPSLDTSIIHYQFETTGGKHCFEYVGCSIVIRGENKAFCLYRLWRYGMASGKAPCIEVETCISWIIDY